MASPSKLAKIFLCAAALLISVYPATTQEPAKTPDNLDAHLGKAYDALKQDRYEEASSEFRAALAIDPKLTLRARFPLAVSLFELHKSDEARRELETVRREAGDHPNILYYLGRLDLDDRNYQGAVQNLVQAVTKPPFPDTAYYLGFAYLKQGDLKPAERWLKEAKFADPRDSRVPYQLALVYRKQGLEDEAKKELALSEQLRANRDNDTRLKTECGQKLDQGPHEEARSFCDQLYDSENADKLTALGTIYGQHGDLEAALEPLQRAAELRPQAPQMQYNLALTYYQLGRFDEARTALAGSLKRWPDLFPIANLYGATLLKLGDDDGAREALEHARQLNPQESATVDMLYLATIGLAQKHQNVKQYPEALRLYQEAVKLRPREPNPHQRMSEIYAVTGHTQQARNEQLEAERLARELEKHP